MNKPRLAIVGNRGPGIIPALLASILSMGAALPPAASVSANIGAPKTAEITATAKGQEEQKAALPASNGAAGQVLQILGGMGPDPYSMRAIRGSGHGPDDWGRSEACRRMVRKNRMRKLGIKGSRI